MVSSVTNFSRNGLADWLVQRVTAVVIGIYAIVMFGFFFSHPHLTYAEWHTFFSCTYIQVGSMLVLICICAHAWIGLWTVFTDYIKCARIRLVLEVLLILLLLSYVIWGISIFWR
jgi:succinate dehydrogenase / fumarate reductase, membrane anchor subunit